MKQAVLILLHKDIYSSLKLITYFRGMCDIFIHIDKDYILSSEERHSLETIPGVIAVYQKYRVHWAGFSILRTEIFLLKEAIKHSDFRYIHLLSGNDYPLMPLSVFLNFFNKTDKEYISCAHMPNVNTDGNTMERLELFFFPDILIAKKDQDVARIWKVARKLGKFGIKKHTPQSFPHIYNGSQWFSISRQCVNMLLKYTRCHPSFYFQMLFGYAPEETYFNTIIMNKISNEKIAQNNNRYIHWPFYNAQHPSILTEKDIFDLATCKKAFARKIDLKNNSLINKIDSLLLCEETINIDDYGIWHTKTYNHYKYDSGLAECIVFLCKTLDIQNVIDLGCGAGYYVLRLRKSKIIARGFDGNPNTKELSKALMTKSKFPCEQLCLHEEINDENITDLIMLVDVGEYIPSCYHQMVIDNICRLTRKHLLLCWASKTPDTESNYKKSENISREIYKYPIEKAKLCDMITEKGFRIDVVSTKILQDNSEIKEHSENILFFTKI